jgi:hypothetical protein
VREAIERSPHRSARRHSLSLGLSEASVRRILHKDLTSTPTKFKLLMHYTNVTAECLERNGGHLNDVIFGKQDFCFQWAKMLNGLN